MEDNTELLEKYIEEGKLPLKGELFSRKAKIAEKLRLYREESRRITVSRQRKRGGERSAALYWGIAAMFIVLLGIGGYYFSEEKLVTETTAMDYELPDGSKVKLMGNSSLSYNRVTWFWERKLQLLGKALFKVTPGKTFTVQTEAGDVGVAVGILVDVAAGRRLRQHFRSNVLILVVAGHVIRGSAFFVEQVAIRVADFRQGDNSLAGRQGHRQLAGRVVIADDDVHLRTVRVGQGSSGGGVLRQQRVADTLLLVVQYNVCRLYSVLFFGYTVLLLLAQ